MTNTRNTERRTFTLTIELGTTDMHTPADIADVLEHTAMVLRNREVAGYEHSWLPEGAGVVRRRGIEVGEWAVGPVGSDAAVGV